MRSYCRYHRQALAAWSCDTCRVKLCADCVAEKVIDKLCVDVCATCGEQVAHIVIHRAETMSYPQRLRTIWRYPFASLGGIVAMPAVGFLFAVASIGIPYLAVALAIFWGFIFVLIQSSARGIDDIEPPDFSTLWESIGAVLFRAFLATSASWLPLILYGWSVKPTLYEALVDPIVWLLVVFGLLYAPMAIMGAAVKTPLIRVLNPLWMVRCAGLLGRDYWLAVGVLGFLTVLQCMVFWIATFIVVIPFPLVPVAVAATLLTYVPFVMARVVGLLLFVCGDKLGYGDPNDYLQRVSTDRPRGVLPMPAKVAPTFDTPDADSTEEKVRPIEVDF